MSCSPSPPPLFHIPCFLLCLLHFPVSRKIYPPMFPPQHQICQSRHILRTHTYLVDRPFHNALGDSVLPPSNVLLNSPQSHHIQILSDGWVWPADFGMPPVLTSCHPEVKPIVEVPHLLVGEGGHYSHF